MAVHEITIGRSGTGKTYAVVHHLVVHWLPFTFNCNYFTNLPLRLDAIAEYLIRHHPDLVSGAIINKIKLMTAADTAEWMNEKSGPWDYFADKDLESGRIVIDEIHNYVHTKSSKEYVQKWRMWLGELRHHKCQFEAISQYETKVHPLIRHEAGLIRRLASSDDKRDPIFWVKFYDHFQLLSKLRGYYASRVWVSEFEEDQGKWVSKGGGSIPLIPEFYQLYNSYSAPIAQGANAKPVSTRSPHPYANMQWPELLRWYVGRNAARFVFFTALYTLFAWLFVFGGITSAFTQVMATVNAKKAAVPSSTAVTTTTSATASTPAAPAALTSPPPTTQTALAVYPAIFTSTGVFDQYGRPFDQANTHATTPAPVPLVVPGTPAPAAPAGVQPATPGRPAVGVGLFDHSRL